MRPLILLTMAFLSSLSAAAQNIAPNPSFENYTTCPPGINGGQGITTTDWTAFISSADYYHSCNNFNVGTPANLNGYQVPSHGNGYIGMYTYNNAGQNDNKEYIRAALPEGQTLQVGTQYKVSLDVSLADKSTTAGNGIGVLFYKNGLGANYDPSWMTWTIPRSPQISYTSYGVLSDTLNWVTLVDTFVADSGYSTILIGGFIPRLSMDTINLKEPPNFFRFAYYYIDNFKVEPIYPTSVPEAQAAWTSAYPNPMKERTLIRFPAGAVIPYSFALVNTLGQQVFHRDNLTGSELIIERAGLPAGVYYYTISSHHDIISRGKLVME